MNHLRSQAQLSLTPRQSSASLWQILVSGLGFMAVSLVTGVALGAYAAGLPGAVGGALLGPILGGFALSGWVMIALGVRLVLPPRDGTGAGSTLLIVTGCAWLAAMVGLLISIVSAVPLQAGAVVGVVVGLLAGLLLDVALYD